MVCRYVLMVYGSNTHTYVDVGMNHCLFFCSQGYVYIMEDLKVFENTIHISFIATRALEQLIIRLVRSCGIER